MKNFYHEVGKAKYAKKPVKMPGFGDREGKKVVHRNNILPPMPPVPVQTNRVGRYDRGPQPPLIRSHFRVKSPKPWKPNFIEKQTMAITTAAAWPLPDIYHMATGKIKRGSPEAQSALIAGAMGGGGRRIHIPKFVHFPGGVEGLQHHSGFTKGLGKNNPLDHLPWEYRLDHRGFKQDAKAYVYDLKDQMDTSELPWQHAAIQQGPEGPHPFRPENLAGNMFAKLRRVRFTPEERKRMDQYAPDWENKLLSPQGRDNLANISKMRSEEFDPLRTDPNRGYVEEPDNYLFYRWDPGYRKLFRIMRKHPTYKNNMENPRKMPRPPGEQWGSDTSSLKYDGLRYVYGKSAFKDIERNLIDRELRDTQSNFFRYQHDSLGGVNRESQYMYPEPNRGVRRDKMAQIIRRVRNIDNIPDLQELIRQYLLHSKH